MFLSRHRSFIYTIVCLISLSRVLGAPWVPWAWADHAPCWQNQSWWYDRWYDACIVGNGEPALRVTCAVNDSVQVAGQFFDASQRMCSNCTARKACETGEYFETCKQQPHYAGEQQCEVAPANRLTIAEGFRDVVGTAAYTSVEKDRTLVAVLDRRRHAIAVIDTLNLTWAWRVGMYGVMGDGVGVGTAAQFTGPRGLAHLQKTAIIVVNDYGNQRIVKVDMATLNVSNLMTNVQVEPIAIAAGSTMVYGLDKNNDQLVAINILTGLFTDMGQTTYVDMIGVNGMQFVSTASLWYGPGP